METPAKVTKKQLDALMSDWFERDGTTFVHKRKDRLGWEESLETGAAYSEYMLSPKSVKDLIRNAYSLGKDTLVAMDLPHRISVRISRGSTSATSGRVVFLSTKVFDDEELGVGERLDVFLGLAVHEGCHVLWTDFSKKSTSKLCHTLCNILEDERIETLCSEERPGFACFLEKVKAYYFDSYYKRLEEKALLEKGTPFDRFMDMFLRIIRYPKYLDEKLFVTYYKYLVQIKEILVPYPKSTAECLEAARKIEEIIREFYKDEMTKERSSEKGESSEKEESSESEESKEHGESKEDTDESEETEEHGGDEEDTEESADEFEKEEVVGTAEVDPADIPSIGEVLAAMRRDFESSDMDETLRSFGLSDEEEVSAVIDADVTFAEVVEGEVILGTTRDVFFTKATCSREDRYDASYDRVSRYVPAISRILKSYAQEYKFILHGMRSGKLDPGKICEAYQGVPTVYLREGEVRTEDVCVCLLIDESGSMGGRREVAARDTGVLINEAIGKVPNVDLFIYGHTGDVRERYSTDLTIYREHGFAPRKALGESCARAQNRDGTAIYEVAKRVRKQTDRPVLMFVISDGAPCAGNYHGLAAITHTKRKVEEVERMGFAVVQICISPEYDPSLMFKHFVILKDMSTLSLELSKVVKEALLKHVKKLSK